MKKYKIVLIGAISLLLFGLLLPLPIQALLVLVDSPMKEFFSTHVLLLCVVVGMVQGLFEEGGYFLAFRTILKKEQSGETPIMFGLGRSILHTIFDIGTIIAAGMSGFGCFLSVTGRIFSFGALMGLTLLDYTSNKRKRVAYLILSIVLHAIMNAVLVYATESDIFTIKNNYEAMFLIGFSCVVMIFSVLICKNVYLKERCLWKRNYFTK